MSYNNDNLKIKVKKSVKNNKIIKRTKKTKKNLGICAPNSINNTGSCFTRKGLEKIARAWNKENKDKIKLNKDISNEELWELIGEKMEKLNCNNELCWRDNKIVKNTYSKYDKDLNVFKPIAPNKWKKNPREWLNTLNINDVLKQYEDKYKDFKYFGAVPIDFDKKIGFSSCVVNEICNLNIKKLYNQGYKKIGFVFNTDPHDKPGQHWIAMYCDLNIPEVNYWDSYGIKPKKEINDLAKRIINQGGKLGLNVKYNINKNKHQYKNTECGVYSINFIVSQLEGNTFKNTVDNIINDDKMWEKRKNFFIHI